MTYILKKKSHQHERAPKSIFTVSFVNAIVACQLNLFLWPVFSYKPEHYLEVRTCHHSEITQGRTVFIQTHFYSFSLSVLYPHPFPFFPPSTILFLFISSLYLPISGVHTHVSIYLYTDAQMQIHCTILCHLILNHFQASFSSYYLRDIVVLFQLYYLLLKFSFATVV